MLLSSIKAKLYAMMAGVISAVVVLVGVNIHAQQNAERERIDLETIGKLDLGEVTTALVSTHLWTQSAVTDLLSESGGDVAAHRTRYEESRAEVDRAWSAHTALSSLRHDEGARLAFAEAQRRLNDADDATWVAIQAGDLSTSHDRIVASRALYLSAISIAARVADTEATALAARAATTQHGREQESAFQIAIVTIALVGVFLLAWQVRRSVLGPLGRLSEASERLTRGEYDPDLGPRPNDEFGRVHDSLTTAITTLADLGRGAEQLAAGNLAVAFVSRGPTDQVPNTLNLLARTLKDAAHQADTIASGNYAADILPRGKTDELGLALHKMTRVLRDVTMASAEKDWHMSGVATINEIVLGQRDVQLLVDSAVSAIAAHLDAQVGVIYVREETTEGATLRLLGSYAFTSRRHLSNTFRLGEGLVGQAALERKTILLQGVPEDYIRIVSGLGEVRPQNILVVPVVFKATLRGVLEFATLRPVTHIQQQYVEQAAAVLGVALEIAANQAVVDKQQEELRNSNEELQRQTRALEHATQELRAQQVELEQSNAELDVQMGRTQESEGRLKVQHRELATANEELESRNRELERQKSAIERAGRELAHQAEELSVASKYKSEFLANMSHELRTPLNSLLLLARSLRDNPEGNLTEEQREAAGVIFAGGNDLLNLINEILDLSKIEAGRMDLRMETVAVRDVAQSMVRQFEHMARSQGLALRVEVAPDVPEEVKTDPNRLGQILKNLMGNALKFTEAGSVSLSFCRPGPDENLSRPGLSADSALAIRVVDTGIGIPTDKQRIVFEAFQQADSGDRRKYGGTGLGLSISRELAALLGGEIHLHSEVGVGSTFTLVIPLIGTARGGTAPHPAPAGHETPIVERSAPEAPPAAIADDRDSLEENDRTILIIEDDASFAGVLVNEVRRRGFRAIAALNGKEGMELARTYRLSGVVLDIHLPDTSGWRVLSALKRDMETRHIPVHIVSADEATLEGLRIGAIGHAHKPLQAEDIDTILATITKSSASAEKLVLVVEDDLVVRKETVRIIGNGNVHVQEVGTGTDALAALVHRRFDLMVLDLGLPDMQGLELLKVASARNVSLPPVIVYTVRELTTAEELALRDYADSIIIKDVRSQERLIDEVALFLHRVVNDLPEDKRRTIKHIYESDERLRGAKVLIVDDDMRTMFAMAKLLAGHGINPLKAANGQQALVVLAEQPDVDLVLLDMMMPVLDGYETVRQIRAQEHLRHLPVIALTAKAMKEDRQKCIEAGASDYLTKPVDQDRLLSLMRVWLSR
jgi:signal transduction histidine kinase/DNA-binding response OmpR family regulator